MGTHGKSLRASSSSALSRLGCLDPNAPHSFFPPVKRINEGEDVSSFLVSKAYNRIMTFLFQLNEAAFPSLLRQDGPHKEYQAWEVHSPLVKFSKTVDGLRNLLQKLELVIEEAPPDPGPRRFGNVSFRKWYQIVESRLPALLEEHLPRDLLQFGKSIEGDPGPADELSAYFLGSFGSSQRLDYGTGHELSFLAFVGCIWRLGGFSETGTGDEERGIVFGVIDPYLSLIRRLIETYTLEPAGSHGVWGLDDHSFIPYIFGSAQFSPAVSTAGQLPAEGSLPGAPDPGDITKISVVERERKRNMYFGAVGFIYDVKKGPFWEHSPILYDISGVRAGWAKINKGMIKMYNAEVLSKFPVVQHFPFGSLFSWERDPTAAAAPLSAHTSSQPSKTSLPGSQATTPPPFSASQGGTKAPWAAGAIPAAPPAGLGQTAAPWANPGTSSGAGPGTRAPWSAGTTMPPPTRSGIPSTRAPWASSAQTGLPPQLHHGVKEENGSLENNSRKSER